MLSVVVDELKQLPLASVVFLGSRSCWRLPGLALLRRRRGRLRAADSGGLVASIPVLLLFVFAQRYLIEGALLAQRHEGVSFRFGVGSRTRSSSRAGRSTSTSCTATTSAGGRTSRWRAGGATPAALRGSAGAATTTARFDSGSVDQVFDAAEEGLELIADLFVSLAGLPGLASERSTRTTRRASPDFAAAIVATCARLRSYTALNEPLVTRRCCAASRAAGRPR